MINLLPPEKKQAFAYARRNTKLVRWLGISLVCLLSIAGVILFGQFYLDKTIKSYERQVQEGQQQLKVQGLEQTQARLNDISNTLKLVVQVLSQEVLFSKLVQQIGSVMPDGAVLTDLNINQVGGGLDLKAATLNQSLGAQVQLNLQDPTNKIFDKVDIVNINCGENLYAEKYPCTVQVRASFAACNPYLFINNSAACKKAAESTKP
jgi:Tfp pilus assembly protein PilN